MKCIALRACLAFPSGQVERKSVFFDRHQIGEFDECPTHFAPLEGEEAIELDFTKAPREVLEETKWSFKEAAEVILRVYGVTLKKKSKDDIIDQILDARFRNDPRE